jgi:hypothetical protein
MIVRAIYKINERYVVGDDKSIYRLPYTENKKSFKLRKIKQHRGGYFIDKKFVEKAKIPFDKITPFELINDEKLPF